MSVRPVPVIESPCATLPAFAVGQKLAVCHGCKKNVHNLSAYSSVQQEKLLASNSELCVRYRVRQFVPGVTASLILAAVSCSAQAQESESASTQAMHSEIMVIGGGRPAFLPLEPMFIEEEHVEPASGESR
jgi:hypothetical protein